MYQGLNLSLEFADIHLTDLVLDDLPVRRNQKRRWGEHDVAEGVSESRRQCPARWDTAVAVQ